MTPQRNPDPRLIEYTPLVRSRVHRYLRTLRWIATYDELFSIGMEALWRATERFEEGRGASFMTFACKLIDNDLRCEWMYWKRGKRLGARRVDSMDAPNPEGHLPQFATSEPSVDDIVSTAVDIERVRRSINRLPRRERHIVQSRLAGRELSESVTELGVNARRIRQLEERAIEKLRWALRDRWNSQDSKP